VPIFVDPTSNFRLSNPYHGATWVLPNVDELAALVGLPVKNEEWIIKDACKFYSSNSGANLVVTRSEHGILLYENGEVSVFEPEHEEEIVDPCGAGDVVAAVFATMILKGLSAKRAAEIAGEAGTMAVRHRHTSQLDVDEAKKLNAIADEEKMVV
jgi:D-beta-D-heptose 7-phosphate kinase/D-beta-D-heptose 1-phosphate adenosyltransferase